MRKLITKVCALCNKTYETRLQTTCCSRLCSNKYEALKRKTQVNSSGLTRAQEIAIASAKTMKERGWYGSEDHLKSLKHTPEVRKLRGQNIRKALLQTDQISGKTKAALAAEKQIATKVERGLYIDPKNKTQFELYASKVRVLTEKQDLTQLKGHENRGRAGIEGAYHLDHIYSIKSGFINNVDPSIIASIHNLRFITYEENISKLDRCDISLEHLIERIEFGNNNNNKTNRRLTWTN